MTKLILAVLVPWFVTTALAQVPMRGFQIVDSTITVSLLTCSPGQEVYELYGHTALRVQWKEAAGDTIAPRETVYNYGVFDFNQPHFTWHFTLGECDYIVAEAPLEYFLYEYAYRGSSVTEQVLDLQPSEARRLLQMQDSLVRPENRIYRYDIFRNNCTTKARDIIEACINGEVIYPIRPRRNTYRTILKQFTKGHEWAREGSDILLGAAADTLLTERGEQFAPIYLMQYFDSAFVDRGRTAYSPLVKERRELLPINAERQLLSAAEQTDFPLSPRTLWWLMLGLGLLIGIVEIVRRRVCWPVDAVLMTAQGLAGCLVLFMTLCSQHPTVATNWQVWVLNPLPLFFVYAVVKADRRRKRSIYHIPFAVWYVTFIALYVFLPQDFSALILPLALLLLSRALVHLIIYRRL